MIRTGAIVNSIAIIIGGLCGRFVGRFFDDKQQEALNRACGVCVLFIATAGAMEGMLKIEGSVLTSGRAMFIVLCIAIGTVIGELIGIEKAFERFGEWLKHKTGNSGDIRFVDAFVTTSLTVCIGAMAIVGSIEDGILGDHTTLYVKSVLDMIIVAVMTSSMGKGSAYSAIPIFLFEGSITLLSTLIAPLMSEQAILNMSLVGSILIFCVGINLVWGKRVRVANMLPAVLVAVLFAYLPWTV
ncbi:MAG: DUF554 domain-containing protein [Erysipelotrichaceae bacterium]|nr:DUF554 domain-containing protein [Erysipelotrichaceae bacterium]